jgi:hypothetical protein
MTHDAAITATYQEFVADLRDKVGGLTGWSIAYDSSGADPYPTGNTFAWQTPTGEYIECNYDGALTYRYGTDYDTGTGSWNTEWSQPGGNSPDPVQGNYQSIQPTDQVQYWLSYFDRGFVYYVSREVGDGGDGGAFVGFAEISKTWDYTTAQTDDSEMAYAMEGKESGADYGGVNEMNRMGRGASDDNTAPARGLLNPDGNFGNFPMTEQTFQHCSTYDSGLVGTHDLWALDDSDTRTAHLDTVDVGGTPTWKVVKEYLSTPRLMRIA